MKILVCIKQVPDMESGRPHREVADVLVVADVMQFVPALTARVLQ